VKFSDLQYIAFEGGGGKGAVYKGAIVALEKLCDKAWRDGTLLKMQGGELIKPPISEVPEPPDIVKTRLEQTAAATAILDYYEVDHENLKIKGISGASAGAIIAFPLALGLTSGDIEEILSKYPFSEELLPNHKLNVGRYRMVGMGKDGTARVLSAEDHWRKLGEDRLVPYLPNLSDTDFVGDNSLKDKVRRIIISTGLSIIFTGLKDNWPPVQRLIDAIIKFIAQLEDRWTTWLKTKIQQIWQKVTGNSNVSKLLTMAEPILWNKALKLLLKIPGLDRLPTGEKNQLKLLHVFPLDNAVSAVGNAVWDRGVYGAFAVRDFFFKIVLKSLSKDTHFRRGLIENTDLLASINVTQENLDHLAISFDSRYNVSVAESDTQSRTTLVNLRGLLDKLTFRQFHQITDLNLSICATNLTSNQPLYFSHYFTPDFPVLEAVGASMSFPFVFKPVYNEANVLLVDETAADQQGNSTKARMFLNPSDFVKFEVHQEGRYFAETFSMRDYNKHLAVLLNYIKTAGDLKISVNANLSFRSFLPYLRKLIETDSFKLFTVVDHVHDKSETYDAGYIKALCYFYYNSAFKGLLIDGGVTNNLPISIFTLAIDEAASKTVQSLDIKKTVLGLKLDNSFPDIIKDEAFKLLKADKSGKTLKRLSNWQDTLAHYTFAQRIFNNLTIRKAFERNQEFTSLGREAWIKVSKELVSEYKDSKSGFTPWNKQVNAFSGLLNALQFGMDQGQIENIEDNENIIPLYCFGLDTLNFDITSKDMKPLVEMAVKEADRVVTAYFR